MRHGSSHYFSRFRWLNLSRATVLTVVPRMTVLAKYLTKEFLGGREVNEAFNFQFTTARLTMLRCSNPDPLDNDLGMNSP